MLSKCCNIIDAMCSLNVAQYIANILSNYCQYIAQYLASLTIDSICSIFFVVLTCVPCASAPSCGLMSNLLRPARGPAKSAPCNQSLSDCLPGARDMVRRRSTAARGAMSPQPQPAAPPTERSAQRQLHCPATALSVATCPVPAFVCRGRETKAQSSQRFRPLP